MRSFVIAAALSLVAATFVAAQDYVAAPTFSNPLSLSVGDEISVREPAAGGKTLSGRVSAIEAGAIRYEIPGEGQQYFRPYVGIDTIAVKRHVPRQQALIGAAWGAFLGGAAGLISGPFHAASSTTGNTATSMAMFGAAGGAGGALVGAAVGAVLFPRKWYLHVLR